MIMQRWPNAASKIGVTLLLGATAPGVVSAQDQKNYYSVMKGTLDKLLIVDGPYELVGATGVYGFVVARSGAKATFRPCTGPMIDVDQNKLKHTSLQCKDEAPENGNPVSTAACPKTLDIPSPMIAAVNQNAQAPVGTFFAMSKTSTVEVYASSDVNSQKQLGAVAQIQNCGAWAVGLDEKGKDVLHFLSSDDAKLGDFGKPMQQ
jgi:hypothetical protein